MHCNDLNQANMISPFLKERIEKEMFLGKLKKNISVLKMVK